MSALSNPQSVEKTVTLSHGVTRYLESGEGPPVILLHGPGLTAGANNWLLNITPLADAGLRVLAVDEVGFGTGDRLELAHSFAYIVDFVREFQDALGIDRSHIVGWSGGGWVASLLAYESPDRVDRLVLVASGGTQTRPLAAMANFVAPTKDQYVRTTARRLSSFVSDSDATAWAEYDWRCAEAPGAVEAHQRLLSHMLHPETRNRYNTVRRLPKVHAETLVIWGDKDEVNDVAMGRDTHRLLPHSKLAIMKGIGHAPPLEAAERFNSLVADFLLQGLGGVSAEREEVVSPEMPSVSL